MMRATCFGWVLVLMMATLAGCAGGTADPAEDNNPDPGPTVPNPDPDCLRDADCPGTLLCQAGECVEGQCLRDADCPRGEICLVDTGICVVPECLQNSDCGTGQFCDPDDKKCKPGCLEDANCPDGQICNRNTQQCEEPNECEVDGDCGDRQVCTDNKCVDVECVRDADCLGAGEVCDTESNRCRVAEGFCDDDGDCPDEDKCDLEQNVCVEVGCPECPEGTTCNEEVGECRECEDDEDCGEGGECDLTDHVCREARCENDGDCPGAQVCNTINGQCEEPDICQDDSLEPNNDQDNPRAVAEGEFDGLTVCEADEDWFSFQVGAGDGIEVIVAFAHAQGNLDVELFDPTLRRIGAGSSNTDDERLFTENLALAGTYLLRVFGFEGAENTYSLSLDITENPDPVCTDDGFEDNDGADSASEVAPGTFDELVVCPGDTDFFRVRLGRGERLTASVNFAHDDGDLDLVILGAENAEELGASRSQDDNETATTPAAETNGDVLVVVSGSSPAVGNTYQLVLDVEEVVSPCEDDSLEPNDTRDEARTVAPDLIDNLRLCPGDEDFYAIGLNAGDDIVVDLGFTHDNGDLDMLLFAPNSDEPIADSRTRTDDEQVSFTDVPVSGIYLIRVLGAEPSVENDYFMIIERTERPPVECTEDDFEDNDNIEQPAPVGPGEHIGQVCSGDEDWFSIQANAGGRLSATLNFDGGNLDLEVFSPSGDSIGVSANGDGEDDAVVLDPVPDSGTYRIRVHGPQGAEALFGLTLAVQEPACPDDADEDNDDADNATLLDLQASLDLGDRAICAGDDDFYAVELSVGDGLTAAIFFNDQNGETDLDLQILDEDGVILANSVSVNDNEEATVGRVETAGLYFVRVFGFLDSEGDYDLSLSLIDGGTDCDDDFQEPNDSAQRPRAINIGTLPSLQICPGDEDFYTIDLEEGEILEVDLSFIDADGDIDIELLDPNEARIAQGFTVTDNETVSARARVSGTHFIRVFSFITDTDNSYSMTTNVLAADNCLEDTFEENDTPETAATVFTSAENLGLCQEDGEQEEDWFRFTTFEDGDISVTILFSDEVGDLDLEIYREGEDVELDASLGVRDSETVEVLNAPAGTYLVRVFTIFRDRFISEYDLTVESP